MVKTPFSNRWYRAKSICLLWVCMLPLLVQGQSPLSYQSYFNVQIKPWAQSFRQFKLADFKQKGPFIVFEAVNATQAKSIKQFYPAYRAVLSYSPNGKQVIDIYSYLLLEKRGGRFYTSGNDVEQDILLGNITKKTWLRIAYYGYNQRVQEVCWINNHTFMLLASAINKANKMTPKIIIADTQQKGFKVFESVNANCYQLQAGYQSPKLKTLNIKSL